MSVLLEQLVKTQEKMQKGTGRRIESQAREMELKKAEKFRAVIQQMQKRQRLELQRIREKDQERTVEAVEREKEQKISELRGLIAQLKNKLSSAGFDPSIANQISQLETELFWLLFSI